MSALVFVALGFSLPMHAADVLWVGRTQATVAWDAPSSGIIDGYLVFVSRNGGPEIGEQLVTSPRATLTGKVGDRISVRIRSIGRATPTGPQVVSPFSPPSPAIQFIELTPPSAPSGLLIQHCSACQTLRLRPIANPSLSFDRFAPPAPWRLIGAGRTGYPDYEQLWQHADSGALLLIGIDSSASVVAATSVPNMTAQRALRLAEMDGDPEPEIITHYAPGSSLVFWERRELEILPIGYMSIPSGWNLVGAEDADGDGKADLWFQWGNPGTVDVLSWSPGGLTWLGRLATGVAGDVVAVADFDGDATPDLLWQDATGNLTSSYTRFDSGRVSLVRNLRVPRLPGDEKLEVRGVADLAANPGLEIVVQNTETFAIGGIVVLGTYYDVRVPLVDSDVPFELVRAQ